MDVGTHRGGQARGHLPDLFWLRFCWEGDGEKNLISQLTQKDLTAHVTIQSEILAAEVLLNRSVNLHLLVLINV